MTKGREHQCLWRPGLIVLGLVWSALSTATAWSQNSAPPQPPSEPAAQSQPAAGSRPGAATEPPAPGQPAGSAAETPATPPDKVVMRVGNEQVTAGEIEAILRSLPQAFRRAASTQGMKVVGDQYSVLLALSQKAASDGLDKTPEFKQKMELQRLQWLAQDEYQKLASEVKASPEEITQYYQQNQTQFEQVEIRQVSVRKKLANGPGNAPGLPEADARARAEAIRQALSSGQDAAKVADQYKMPNIVFFDPNPHPVRRGQLPGEMDKIAWTLKDGEASDIQDNPMNFYFIQVVKHDQQELKDVSSEIESRIKQQAFEKQLDALKQQANIWLDPQYFGPPKPPAPEPPAANPQAQSSKPQ